MFTFGQIMEEVAPNIGTGYSAASEEARRLVRRTIQRVFTQHPSLLTKYVELYAFGDMFVMPNGIAKIKKYWMAGRAMRPQNKLYEFMEAGHGLARIQGSPSTVLLDRGYTPVVYQPPSEMPLLIMSDRDENDALIVIRGMNDADKEVRSANGTVGETVQITAGNTLIRTRLTFSEITSFVKPTTNGYIHLYAVDDTTGAQYYLARYEPSDRVAAFRQYRLPGYNFDSNEEPYWTKIDALVVLRAPNPYNDDDIIPFGDMASIEMIARSLKLMQQQKYKEAKLEADTGMALASEYARQESPDSGPPDIDCEGFMMGDVETL